MEHCSSTLSAIARNQIFIKMPRSPFYLLLLALLIAPLRGTTQEVLDKYKENRSVTHREAIDMYGQFARQYEEAELVEQGPTDAGRPLHLFLLSGSGKFEPTAISEDKPVLFINNGIHPGEPCGIDAALNLAHDILKDHDGMRSLLDRVVIAIVPVYNIGGSLNRSCCTRANQNGPKMQGFRGNARNLDLNRDFIKCDSRNALSFSKMYRKWDPDVFVDTHTSNGADHQHTMTLIATQRDKLHPALSGFMTGEMLPFLYERMSAAEFPMVPYVHTRGKTPESGIKDYLETPRYSSGYSTLFNAFGFITETHMLKPYKDRVEATYRFLVEMIRFMEREHEQILEKRARAKKKVKSQNAFPIQWELDTTRVDTIDFLGYAARKRESSVTGMEQLYYDQEAPYERKIPYYNHYRTADRVDRPAYYIVPQGWKEVVERLKVNDIKMNRLKRDTTVSVHSYYISEQEALEDPYEGHFFHRKVETEKEREERDFLKGDYVVPVDQAANRYIVETLEPRAADSYFRWNFFDEVLQQKEYFSSYVFDKKAEKILEQDPELKEAFQEKKANDPGFRKDKRAQLDFIYRRSPYYEDEHRRYPVARIEDPAALEGY